MSDYDRAKAAQEALERYAVPLTDDDEREMILEAERRVDEFMRAEIGATTHELIEQLRAEESPEEREYWNKTLPARDSLGVNSGSPFLTGKVDLLKEHAQTEEELRAAERRMKAENLRSRHQFNLLLSLAEVRRERQALVIWSVSIRPDDWLSLPHEWDKPRALGIYGMRLKLRPDAPPHVLELLELQDEPEAKYVSLPQEVKISADSTTKRLTEHLANRTQPQHSGVEGWQKLEPPEPNRVFKTREFLVRAHAPDNITHILDPEAIQPALERILKERNERKAKTFLGSLAIGQTSGNPESFVIKVADLLRLIHGYELGKTTNSANYWKGVAEVIKYLIVDLAWLEISVQVMLYSDKKPKHMQDYLMHRPRVITPRPLLFDNFVKTVLDLAPEEKEGELIAYLKTIKPEGLVLGFTRDALEALGAASNYNALEYVSHELLTLKGPAFWLGYNIAFLRRWSNGACPPGKGKLLLEALDESGYVETATKSSRNTSYKDALRSYQGDLQKLVEIGMLEDPGAAFYAYKGGRWCDISQQLKGWTQARGVRLTREKLSDIRVVYEFPAKRLEERKAANKKARSIREANQRAKAGNEGRAKKAKKAN